MPPPAQPPPPQRAAQLPARQRPLDQCPVTVYREHDASKRQPSGPPRGLRQKDNGEGRAKSDAPTVPAPAPGCNPATHRPVGKAPPPTQSRSATRPLHPHRHPQRRFPAPAIRILSAVEQTTRPQPTPASRPRLPRRPDRPRPAGIPRRLTPPAAITRSNHEPVISRHTRRNLTQNSRSLRGKITYLRGLVP